MPRTWLKPALLLVALLLTTAAAPVPQPAAPDPTSETAPRPGELLIASASVQDPRFYHAVILILRHNRGGAFGIVINRPLADSPIAALLAAIGDKRRGVTGAIPVLIGGPVAPNRGFVVHSPDYRGAGTLAVDGKVAMTPTPRILYDIGHGKGPARRFFAVGYTGWAPGQLESEIARHDWFIAPDNPALVFAPDRAGLWHEALAQREQQL